MRAVKQEGPCRPGWGDQGGQTATEYLMILGLLTAMIIALTGIIVPTIGFVVVRLVTHIAVFVSST